MKKLKESAKKVGNWLLTKLLYVILAVIFIPSAILEVLIALLILCITIAYLVILIPLIPFAYLYKVITDKKCEFTKIRFGK